VDRSARHDQGVGGQDDNPGGVLEQAGRQRRGAQLMGGHQGTVEFALIPMDFIKQFFMNPKFKLPSCLN